MNHKGIVFFDWGGVVTDDAGDDFFVQLLVDIGASRQLAQRILHAHLHDLMCGRVTDGVFWSIVQNEYRLRVPEDIYARQSDWVGLTPNPVMVTYIQKLRDDGVRVAALTNVIRSSFDTLQSRGHYDQFEFVTASCNEGVSKPSLKIYEAALKQGGVSAKQCILIDDKQRNIDAAEKLGFQVVLATNADQTIKNLERIL